ncbi:TIR domain-containing protein [Candidatus Bathyarchaeota archaeon]|nr:TIR domain-containing protein [Candidatus Bathyarchaeota archaeon]
MNKVKHGKEGTDIPFEAYNGTESFIFASYSHKDKEIVYPELFRLYNVGYRIWYDEGIIPSDEWLVIIPEKIEQCAFFVVFISASSILSRYVKREINHAIKHDKPFLAVYLEKTSLPKDLDFQISIYQHMNLSNSRNCDHVEIFEQVLPDKLRGNPIPREVERTITSREQLHELFQPANKAGNSMNDNGDTNLPSKARAIRSIIQEGTLVRDEISLLIPRSIPTKHLGILIHDCISPFNVHFIGSQETGERNKDGIPMILELWYASREDPSDGDDDIIILIAAYSLHHGVIKFAAHAPRKHDVAGILAEIKGIYKYRIPSGEDIVELRCPYCGAPLGDVAPDGKVFRCLSCLEVINFS